MELERPMDDDFGDRLAACYERIAVQTGKASVNARSPSIDDTVDDDLKSCLECLTLIDRVRRRQEIGSLLSSRVSNPTDRHSHLPRTLGHFTIERELGRGGAGIVLLATDTKLGRKVALKVPHPQILISDELRRRFVQEAEATARFDHPHIVRVYEAGQEGPISFIASEYCDGPTLQGWQAALGHPVPHRIGATMVRDLAEAVAHAHSQSVVHRDIKPGNVLVFGSKSESDQEVPLVKLCDFGLAKVIDEEEEHTQTGDLLGTPAYMAPEQAEGKLREIETRTDVYALGALLFELLCGRPPFEGETRSAILLKVIHDDPPDIRSIRKDAPVDLAVIVSKSLSKSKKDRYGSAQELADEIRRHLNGEPIHARPLERWERLFKWARRRPAAAIAAALALALPLTVLAISLWANAALLGKNREIMRRLYAADMRAAKQAVDEFRMEEAQERLAKYEPAFGSPDVRTIAWRLIDSKLDLVTKQEWKYHETDIYSIAVSPDETMLATASRDGTACLWRMGSEQLVHRLIGHERDVNVVLFSPDGKQLVTSGDDGTVRLWETATGNALHVMKAHLGEASCLAITKDGKRLFSGGLDGAVHVWDTQTGKKIDTLCADQGMIDAIALARNESSLIIASEANSCFCVNLSDKQVKWQAENQSAFRCGALAVCPNSSVVVVLTFDSTIIYFDSETGEELLRNRPYSGQGLRTAGLAIHSNGVDLFIGNESGLLEQRQMMIDAPARHLHSRRSRIWSIELIDHDQSILLSTADGIVRRQQLPTRDRSSIRTLAQLNGLSENLHVDRHRQLLYAAGGNDLVVIDLSDGRIARSKHDMETTVYASDVRDDERLIATGEVSGRVFLWNSETLGLVAEAPTIIPTKRTENRPVDSVRFVPGSPQIIYATDCNRRMRVWDYAKKEIAWESDHQHGHVHDMAFLPDGRLITACDGGVVGYHSANGFLELLNDPENTINCRSVRPVAGSHNALFVLSSQGGRIGIRSISGGHEQLAGRRLIGGEMTGLAVNSAGTLIVAPGTHGEICHFAMTKRGLEVERCRVIRDAEVRCAEFSADESTIYASLADGRIIATPVETDSVDEFIDPTLTMMHRVFLSPSMNFIAVDDDDASIKFLDASPLRRSSFELSSEFDTANFSPDGSHIIASRDNAIWSISTVNRTEPSHEIGKLVDKPTYIAVLASGKLLVKDEKQVLRIIDLSDRSKDSVLWDAADIFPERMAASLDGRLVAASMTDKTIRCWNIDTNAEFTVGVPEMVRALAFGHDGRNLAVGCLHGLIMVLDLESKEWAERLTCVGNADVRSVAFADRDQTLFAANSQGGLQIWDLATNEMIFSMDNDLRIEDIQISATKDVIAVCGRDDGGRGILRLHRLNKALSSSKMPISSAR